MESWFVRQTGSGLTFAAVELVCTFCLSASRISHANSAA